MGYSGGPPTLPPKPAHVAVKAQASGELRMNLAKENKIRLGDLKEYCVQCEVHGMNDDSEIDAVVGISRGRYASMYDQSLQAFSANVPADLTYAMPERPVEAKTVHPLAFCAQNARFYLVISVLVVIAIVSLIL